MNTQNPLLAFASHVTDLSKDLKGTLQTALFDKRCTLSELKDLSGKINAVESVAVEFESVIHALSETLKPLREMVHGDAFDEAVRFSEKLSSADWDKIRGTLARTQNLMARVKKADYFRNEIDTKLEQATAFLCTSLERLTQHGETAQGLDNAKSERYDQRWAASNRPPGVRRDVPRSDDVAMDINGIIAGTAVVGKNLMSLVGNLHLAKAMIAKLGQDSEADISPWWRFWDRTEMDEAKRLIDDMRDII